MKKVIVLIFLILFFPPSIKAAECTDKEIVRLNNIAINLDLTYDYYYVGNKVRFKITITNLHKDIYIYDLEHFKNIYYGTNPDNPSEIIIDDFISGSSYQFKVYGNSGGCLNRSIMTRYVTVPGYNSYSQDEICIGIEDLDLCHRWKPVTMSYENFVNRVNEYKKENSIEEQEEKSTKKDFEDYLKDIVDFLLEYYLYYVSAIILFIFVIFLLRKKDNFNLE